jgi:hypothetical protein
MATSGTDPHRELAYRVNDGVEVKLLWNQMTDDVTVTVSDQRSRAYFELDAPPGGALDVFNHPYAYAAFWGVPYATRPCLPSTQGAALLATDGTEEPTSAMSRTSKGRFAIGLMMLATLMIVAVIAVAQIGKWTCEPPDGVWVEGPDHCMEMP